MLFIPSLPFSGVGGIALGLNILPQGYESGIRAWVIAQIGALNTWRVLLQQGTVPPSPALTAAGAFCSLAPCWQQPMAISHLCFPEQVLAPPRNNFASQSSVVVPNSPLYPPKVSRAAMEAAPQFWGPSWLPTAAASLRSSLPACRACCSASGTRSSRQDHGQSRVQRQRAAQHKGRSAHVSLCDHLPGHLAWHSCNLELAAAWSCPRTSCAVSQGFGGTHCPAWAAWDLHWELG